MKCISSECRQRPVAKAQGIYNQYWLCLRHLRSFKTFPIVGLATIGYEHNPELVCSLLSNKPVDWEEFDLEDQEMGFSMAY